MYTVGHVFNMHFKIILSFPGHSADTVCQALFRSKKSGNQEFFSQKSGGYQEFFSIKSNHFIQNYK